MKPSLWILFLGCMALSLLWGYSNYSLELQKETSNSTVHSSIPADSTSGNKEASGSSAGRRHNCSIVLRNENMKSSHCYCPTEAIDSSVPEALHLLNEITASPYFRYFKINTDKPCPYWAVSLLCTSAENTCNVCKCNEESVPTVLRTSSDMSDLQTPTGLISQRVPHPANADAWGAWFSTGEEDGAEYVDLIQNPEGNTGYSGPLAANVWKAIYQENCFPLEHRKDCDAFNLPRKLFSGLHTSIFIHVTTNYFKDPGYESPHLAAGIYNNQNISYLPNCDLFLTRVAPNTDFLENLYILFEFVFRSISLAKNTLLQNLDLYNSGEGGTETEEDQLLKKNLQLLLDTPTVKVRSFDEDQFMLNVAPQHVEDIHAMISNITSLMDCVTCEKCRIWGKLETKGIATAMRIISRKGSVDLDRAERVSLINLARQIAFSVRSVQYMSSLCQMGVEEANLVEWNNNNDSFTPLSASFYSSFECTVRAVEAALAMIPYCIFCFCGFHPHSMSDDTDARWKELQEALYLGDVPEPEALDHKALELPQARGQRKEAKKKTKTAPPKPKPKQSTLAQPLFVDMEFEKQMEKFRETEALSEEPEVDVQRYLQEDEDEDESDHVEDFSRLAEEMLMEPHETAGPSAEHTATEEKNESETEVRLEPTPHKIGLTDEAFAYEEEKKTRARHTPQRASGSGYRAEDAPREDLRVTSFLQQCSPEVKQELGTGGVPSDLFYWIDAKEQPHSLSVDAGSIFLFGKMAVAGKGFQSCCLRVRNTERVVFVLPKAASSDEEAIMELNEVCKRLGIEQRRMKFVERYYGFEEESIPHEKARWIKLRYAGRYPPFTAKGPWRHLHAALGATSSLLELFLIKRRLKGPCFLRVAAMTPASSRISHCRVEFVVESPKLIHVEDERHTTPPFTLVSTQLHSQLNSNGIDNEIVMASLAVYRDVSVDFPLPSKPSCILTGVRRLQPNSALPLDLERYAERHMPNTKTFKVHSFPNERSLLSWVAETLKDLDPDLLVGHNFVGFTLQSLLRRYQELGVPLWSSLGRLDLKRFPRSQGGGIASNQEREVCCGRLIADSYTLSREYFKSTNYKLLALSKEMKLEGIATGDPTFDPGATVLTTAHTATAATLFPIVLQLANSAVLPMCVLSHLDVIRLTKRLSSIAGNLWSRTLYGARSERIEYLLLHAFHDLKFITPDKRSYDYKRQREELEAGGEELEETKRKSKYQGGMVLEPKCGHYADYILLLDFNSLYPSLIQEFNICFTTVDRWGDVEVDVPPPERLICRSCAATGAPSPCPHRCVLPRVIKGLVDQRRDVKRLMARERDPDQLSLLEIRQKALKLTANSMYGCLGFEFSRFFAQPLAELVTRQGRLALQNAVELVPQLNPSLRVIYGDTDSVMIQTGIKNDLPTVRQLGLSLKAAINKKYQSLEIDIDGVFRSILLLKKKKYAALAVEDWTGEGKTYKREVKGLDMVRRDWCPLSKKVCDAVLNRILFAESNDDVLEYIINYMRGVGRDVRDGKIPLDAFVISKSLTKDPEAYRGGSFPHAAVALRMRQRKELVRVGDIIPYVVCRGGEAQAGGAPHTAGHIAERAYHVEEVRQRQLAVDSEWYLASQIYPPVMRLCEHIQGFTPAQLSDVLELHPAMHQQASGAALLGSETSTDFSHWSFFRQSPVDQCFPTALPLQVTCPSCGAVHPIDPHKRVEEVLAERKAAEASGLRHRDTSPFLMYVCKGCQKPLDVRYVANCLAELCQGLFKEFYRSGGTAAAVRAIRTQFTYFRALFDEPRVPGYRREVLDAHHYQALVCVALGEDRLFTRAEAEADELLDDEAKRYIADPLFLSVESYYNRIEHLFVSLDALFQ
eukprot:gene7559-5331_t